VTAMIFIAPVLFGGAAEGPGSLKGMGGAGNADS
jgi:hypothetical protein